MATYGLSIRTNIQILQFQTFFTPRAQFNVYKVLAASVATFSTMCPSCWGQHGLK